MATKFFGQFLLERGSITREMLLDSMEYQKSIHQPLCALALEKGYLTAEQIGKMDDHRATSDSKFVEIALKCHTLSLDQLEELSRLRSERWVFLGEALVEKGFLTLAKLQELMQEYRKQLPPENEKLQGLLAAVPEKEIVSSMLQTTVDLFIHYTKQIVQVVSAEKTNKDSLDFACLFTQEVTGDRQFNFALALPEGLTLAIASHMMGSPETEVNATVLDAVSEFTNVVVGNGCARLCMKNFNVRPAPPRVMTRETIAELGIADVVAVNLRTMKGDFRVLFFFDADQTNR